MTPDIKPVPLRVLCFGMGAIGTYIGGSLANSGCDVVFVERPEALKVDQLTNLRVRRPADEIFVQNIEIVSDIDALLATRNFDLAILAVKAFDTQGIIDNLVNSRANIPPILCLQNGVENERWIEEKLGKGAVIAGTITSAVSRLGLGDVKLEKLRGVGIETGTTLSEKIIDVFNQAGLNAQGYPIRDDMKWSKLLTNLLVNATTAILDWTPAKVLRHPISYRIEVLQLREALAVMNRLGIKVIDLPGTPVKMLVNLMSSLPLWLGRILIGTTLARGRGAKMPSLHIDLYSGRTRSEVEFLNGAVARIGKKAKIATPVNEVLNDILVNLATGKIDKQTYANKPETLSDLIKAAS
jgi:2-dehydropantoate 2-reductase